MDREELLRSARNLYENPGTNEALKVVLEETYTELKESEDERIRKTLIHIVKGACDKYGIKYKGDDITEEKLLAYLERQKDLAAIPDELVKNYKLFCEHGGRELALLINAINGFNKQKEQQPAEWSEEDERNLSTIVGLINVHYRDYDIVRDEYPINAHNLIDWLNSLPERFSLRPKQEWSEEDEKLLDTMIDMATNSLYEPLCPRGKMIALLKSLRPQPHWKPSEEQMEILQYLCDHSSHPNPDVMPTLESLYHDLQKLL